MDPVDAAIVLNRLDTLERTLTEMLKLQAKINAQLEALLTQRGR